ANRHTRLERVVKRTGPGFRPLDRRIRESGRAPIQHRLFLEVHAIYLSFREVLAHAAQAVHDILGSQRLQLGEILSMPEEVVMADLVGKQPRIQYMADHSDVLKKTRVSARELVIDAAHDI